MLSEVRGVVISGGDSECRGQNRTSGGSADVLFLDLGASNKCHIVIIH